MSETEAMRVLIVDDEKIALKNLEHVMRKEGYDVVGTQSGQTALRLLAEREFDIVLTDLRMEKVDGMRVLKRCRDLHPQTPVILITGFATLESAVLAMKQGAFNYVAKPFKLDEVRRVVAEAASMVSLRRQRIDLQERVDTGDAGIGSVRILTQDARMRELVETARRCARSDCSVLIQGRVGTGKELFARFIHAQSARANGPFLKVNCSALDEAGLAREIFGEAGGGATAGPAGADQAGLLARAARGTLYLDEIDRLPGNLQIQLLQAIEGETGDRAADARPPDAAETGETGATGRASPARIIAAIDGTFQEAVRGDRLRSDLFFRLNVVLLDLPPLCRRRDDIPLLAYSFLKKHAAEMQKDVVAVAPEALSILLNYDFPGNMRELESVIARGVAVSSGAEIRVDDLPDGLRKLQALSPSQSETGRIPTLEEQEMAYIQWVLRETDGNRSAAAQILGIDRVSLWRKLKRLGLEGE